MGCDCEDRKKYKWSSVLAQSTCRLQLPQKHFQVPRLLKRTRTCQTQVEEKSSLHSTRNCIDEAKRRRQRQRQKQRQVRKGARKTHKGKTPLTTLSPTLSLSLFDFLSSCLTYNAVLIACNERQSRREQKYEGSRTAALAHESKWERAHEQWPYHKRARAAALAQY